MSYFETSDERQRFFDEALYGRLEGVIEQSSKFCNDVDVLSEALMWSCYEGHLNLVKWLVEHSAADVNYNSIEVWWKFIPLTAACHDDHLHIVKFLVEM